jgi:septal ring factor EnvC (AmiA/AmiB activator)
VAVLLGWERRGASVLAAMTALLVVALVALAAPAPDAHAADYPSWSDVQHAKKSAAAKAAEVRTIEGLLTGLEAKAARLEDASIAAEAASTAAAGRLATAKRRSDGLQHEVDGARTRAQRSRNEAAAVMTQLYRSGDPALAVWLSGRRSSSLLYRLGALDRIGGSSSAMRQQAVAEQRQAATLGQQATLAAGIRDRLSRQAAALAARAATAERAAAAQVTETKQRSATLQAQLKTLRATYKRTQDQYAQGQAAKAAAAARGRAHANSLLRSSSASSGGSSGGGGSLSPDAARAYAASRMSSYGWDSSQSQCLGWLWYRESGWRWNAYNTSSGAYGIPQSLPASKMASAGPDWRTSSATQINWGLGYLKARYGSPCAAWSHETTYSWY